MGTKEDGGGWSHAEYELSVALAVLLKISSASVRLFTEMRC